ncbi:MAG: glycosyltransferase [Chryseolinea sp.]
MNNGIVLMFDDGYFKYARLCINSIKDNYPKHPEILVFYDGNDPKKIAFLKRKNNLRIMHYEPNYEKSIGLKMKGLNLGIADNYKVFFKYLLWTDVFSAYDNLLHLDADTMVLKPLDQLFKTNEFFAVDNGYDFLFNQHMAKSPKLMRMLREDKIEYVDQKIQMMNAGVFMIPKRYRNGKQLTRLLELTKRYNRHMRFGDQSGISLWCHVNDISFNQLFQYNFAGYYYTNLIENFDYSNIHVFHFSAGWKPDGPIYKTAYYISKQFLHLHAKVQKYLR